VNQFHLAIVSLFHGGVQTFDCLATSDACVELSLCDVVNQPSLSIDRPANEPARLPIEHGPPRLTRAPRAVRRIDVGTRLATRHREDDEADSPSTRRSRNERDQYGAVAARRGGRREYVRLDAPATDWPRPTKTECDADERYQ